MKLHLHAPNTTCYMKKMPQKCVKSHNLGKSSDQHGTRRGGRKILPPTNQGGIYWGIPPQDVRP